ncbi:MAG: hypothetical protein RLW62_17520 [Gammaproteobacteria bacterium]
MKPWLLSVLFTLLAPLAAADVFRFDWPVPAAVDVRATVEKDGMVSTARYRIALAGDAAGELALAFDAFELLEVDGRDARELGAELASLGALTGTLPSLRLSTGGSYLGTSDPAAAIEQTLRLLPDGMPTATRERVAATLRSPAMQALMAQRSGELWNTWVGAWNGLDIAPGATLQGRQPVTVLGRELTRHVSIEHLGDAPGYPGSVRLRMTTLVEGPEVLALVGGLVDQMAGADGLPQAFDSARSHNVTEVITRPSDLVPRYVESIAEVVLRDGEGRAHTRRDRKEFWFEW